MQISLVTLCLPYCGRKLLDRIEWHKKRGDRVVVVLAALDAYIRPWCDTWELEAVCTQLETGMTA